ncbi:glucose 1-dehydrogenase [Paenibacillus filicis]|uniref:Glucose 1-dehydrogenase n=1 Tax=Paenibacillus gyeongsangnamensis TaxID=3388067 RepID=A0ABT4Q5E3_9BACL|nr:glucose 1-dehydrogenase [Paenibacillus filicis]MCZ8512016.1 glucose 1-dehydrogenase [Paenibacillus filicis]
MKAVRVTGLAAGGGPGVQAKAKKLELAEVDKPKRHGSHDVLVRVLCIGLDGTDREIMSGAYGMPPEGEDAITIGHESLGVVEEADPATGLAPGDLVTALVRRPCSEPGCTGCRNGQQDFCETGQFTERGIKGANGYLSEYYVEEARYLIKVPSASLQFGMLAEPQSIVEKVWDEVQRVQQRLIWQPKTAVVLGSGPLGLLAAFTCRCLGLDTVVWSKSPAESLAAELVSACGASYRQADTVAGDGGKPETLGAFLERSGKRADLIFECTGYSPLAFEAMTALGPNGVLALLGVTPGNRSIKVSSDMINQELVLENKCVLGSVNASRRDFETGLYRLQQMEKQFPGLLGRLVTERFTMEEVTKLDFGKIAIKAVVDVVPLTEWEAAAAPGSGDVSYSFSV